MSKVVKFGGSSLASAEQFRKVGNIIRAEKERRYVVPSAPGKRCSADTKVTDMLYGCYALAEEGYDVSSACSPDLGAAQLPIPGSDVTVGDDTEAYWQDAYERLWAVREKGLRPDYPYVEPLTFEDIKGEMPTAPELIPLDGEEYQDRLIGAVRGRLAGVILGKPLEMGFSRQQIKDYLESVGEYPLCDYVSAYSEKLDLRLREDRGAHHRAGHDAYHPRAFPHSVHGSDGRLQKARCF